MQEVNLGSLCGEMMLLQSRGQRGGEALPESSCSSSSGLLELHNCL